MTYTRPVLALAAIPLTFSDLRTGRNLPGRNSPDEFVAVVDVVNQYANTAVFYVVPNAGTGDVKQMLFCRRAMLSTEAGDVPLRT